MGGGMVGGIIKVRECDDLFPCSSEAFYPEIVDMPLFRKPGYAPDMLKWKFTCQFDWRMSKILNLDAIAICSSDNLVPIFQERVFVSSCVKSDDVFGGSLSYI